MWPTRGPRPPQPGPRRPVCGMWEEAASNPSRPRVLEWAADACGSRDAQDSLAPPLPCPPAPVSDLATCRGAGVRHSPDDSYLSRFWDVSLEVFECLCILEGSLPSPTRSLPSLSLLLSAPTPCGYTKGPRLKDGDATEQADFREGVHFLKALCTSWPSKRPFGCHLG